VQLGAAVVWLYVTKQETKYILQIVRHLLLSAVLFTTLIENLELCFSAEQ